MPVVYEVRGFREETWAAKSPELAVSSAHREVESEVETALMRQADAIVTLSDGMRDRLVQRGIAGGCHHGHHQRRGRGAVRAPGAGRRARPPASTGRWTGHRLHLDPRRVRGHRNAHRRDRRAATTRSWASGASSSATALTERLLREFGDSLGLDDGAVIFTGRVAYADINAYYSLIDAFVVPRSDVGVTRLVTPLKPYEAMAMERVVVMSRLDPLMEMIIEGETGVSFTPGDPIDLADVLEPLLWTRSDVRSWAGRPVSGSASTGTGVATASCTSSCIDAWAPRERRAGDQRPVLRWRGRPCRRRAPELHQGGARHPSARRAGRPTTHRAYRPALRPAAVRRVLPGPVPAVAGREPGSRVGQPGPPDRGAAGGARGRVRGPSTGLGRGLWRRQLDARGGARVRQAADARGPRRGGSPQLRRDDAGGGQSPGHGRPVEPAVRDQPGRPRQPRPRGRRPATGCTSWATP